MPVDAERFSAAELRGVSAPGIQAFVSIADLWDIGETMRRMMLGCPHGLTYREWTRAARDGDALPLSVALLTRISAVLGIHEALGILFADEEGGRA